MHIEPASRLTAEQIHDQQWAITLLGQIMERLKSEFDRVGKAKRFDELIGFLIGDHAASPGPGQRLLHGA